MSLSSIQGHLSEAVVVEQMMPIEARNERSESILWHCLVEHLKVDPAICRELVTKFAPPSHFENFVDKFAMQLEVLFRSPVAHKQELDELDALKHAPDFHHLLFENDVVRILENVIDPGELVPFHTHQWPCIMVISQGSRFEILEDGIRSEEQEWGPAVEIFPGDPIPLPSLTGPSYKNTGNQTFMALSFEFKQCAYSTDQTKLSQQSTQEQLPKLAFRPQTPDEAFSSVKRLAARLPWFETNGYHLSLPKHPGLKRLYENPENLSETDKNELLEIFREIQSKTPFDFCIRELEDSKPLINEGLQLLSVLATNWGFDLKEKYEVVVTLYGPGGQYGCASGRILLLMTEQGKASKHSVSAKVLHEIVHIGIEEVIVEKYALSHWEKERLVDLICSCYLGEILPTYHMHEKGDQRLDSFIDDAKIIQNLPLAIANYCNCGKNRISNSISSQI